MKSWLKWAFVRPWPVWALIAVGIVVAWGGQWSIDSGGPSFNKIASALLQALGAFLILISLDGNIGLFAGRSIVKEVLGWAVDYPKKRTHVLTPVSASFQVNYSIEGATSVRPKKLAQRVVELERIVGELRTIISKQHSELAGLIEAARNEAEHANSQTSANLQVLQTKLVESAVGGLEIQFFGVGLALIGSVLSVFS